jgi:hypothetical protein
MHFTAADGCLWQGASRYNKCQQAKKNYDRAYRVDCFRVMKLVQILLLLLLLLLLLKYFSFTSRDASVSKASGYSPVLGIPRAPSMATDWEKMCAENSPLTSVIHFTCANT